MNFFGDTIYIKTYIKNVENLYIISTKDDAIFLRTTKEADNPTQQEACATKVTESSPQQSTPQPEDFSEEMREQLTSILSRRQSGVQLFCVLKGMIDAGVASSLKDAEQMIRELYPEGVPGKPYDMHEIESRMNSLSFAKKIDEWREDDCPLKRSSTFRTYKETALKVRDIFSKKKDPGQK